MLADDIAICSESRGQVEKDLEVRAMREGLQDRKETCYDLWFGGGDIDNKTED